MASGGVESEERAYINPMASGAEACIAYTQIYKLLNIKILGFVGAALGHLVAVKDDRRNP